MISLIIPSKKLDDYLFENVKNYQLRFKYDYEIIIVYDIENKKQYKKYIENFKKHTNFKLIFNPNKGRIHALNLGYCHSRGDIIKCIDADDTLLAEFFEHQIQMGEFLAHCHNAGLVNENKKTIGSYTFDKNILVKDYNFVLRNLKSAPRWTWSFKREIAEHIFPIPPELFAEDIWFCLKIKKFCKDIFHINRDIYLYRQHFGSEWGGITNFSRKVMKQRAKWNLALFPVLLKYKKQLDIENETVFNNIASYYTVLLREKKLTNIILAKTTLFYKAKLLIIFYAPLLATHLINLKWFLSKYILLMHKKIKIRNL